MIQLSEQQIEKVKQVLASKDLFEYCRIVDSKEFYDEHKAPYLKEVCDAIQEFENDDNEALIICMPPRHRENKNNQ